MKTTLALRVGSVLACAAFLLTGCGGGGGGGSTTPPAPVTYTIGGTVSGLASGASVVLQNNGGSNLTVSANGSFTFSGTVSSGGAYAVTVLTQPSSPTQVCTVASGSGSASANVTSVAVTCVTSSFAVSGTVSGLNGSIVIQNNAAGNQTISANGSFSFPAQASGSAYAITVLSHPTGPNQTCTVSNGTGTIGAAAVSNVAINCATTNHTVAATVSGLVGLGLVLREAGGQTIAVTGNGTFTFATPLASGTNYAVTVQTQPSTPAQTCTVANGTGTITNANITNITVACSTTTFTVGGTVSGLAAGRTVVLRNNGGNDLTVSANGSFTFSTPISSGAGYAVTVATQPTSPSQTCTVASGTGTMGAANVTNVAVTCVTNTYTIGGTVSGLAAGGSVVLQNNGGNNLAVSANGAFTFSTPIASGAAYAVTVLTQPTAPAPQGQTCSVTSGSGTTGSANVTSVSVSCVNVDQTAPTVSARTPKPYAIGSRIQGAVITVTFSEAVQTSTVNSSSFTLEGPTGPISGTISFAGGNTQAIFTPSANLVFDDWYTATLTTAVKDVAGNALAANLSWVFNTGKKMAIGFRHACARMVDGRVKCWGNNTYGQLGYDDNLQRGDGVGQATTALAAVNLGAGRTAVALTAGDYHTCAILDDGTAKCWGLNTSGELGQGSVSAGPSFGLGDETGEMAALAAINVGVGRTVIEIAGGQGFTCARLDNNTIKCWGLNTFGQLGQGNTTSLGVAAGDIAAAAAVDLGTGLTPIGLTAAHYHACALLLDGAGARHVKCWGDNRWGQLGKGDTTNRGDGAGEMGANLTDVNLGSGVTAAYIMANGGHTCAKLSTANVKCWGLNTWGQAGLNAGNDSPADPLVCSGAKDCAGDQANEMGDSLTAAISSSNTDRLSVGYRHNCALLTTGALKCWGSNEQGQLGLGTIAAPNNLIGDGAGEIAALASTALKSGAVVRELTAGGFHSCVLNADGTLNCWGYNAYGQLGHNDTAVWGDGAGEMGNSLPTTDIGP